MSKLALYYIASLKHTHKGHEHITWWAKNHCGYTPVLGDNAGQYSREDATKLNDGEDCVAVPIEAVHAVQVPEPYFSPEDPRRFYDQRGPVVENSRANWTRLIAASLQQGRHSEPKPEVFRGKRRAFSIEQVTEVAE